MKKTTPFLSLLFLAVGALYAQDKPQEFKGDIKLDVRESTPDWNPYIRKKAPEGSPNILFILYDDTGLATWSPYGGRVNMPTMDKLAADGLTYTQWHTVALCSPTRSCILTGRNHNLNGMGSITEGANGFPGYSSQIPAQAATLTTTVMVEKYGLTALPLPQNWQTAVGQEYTDAFLAELKSSQ